MATAFTAPKGFEPPEPDFGPRWDPALSREENGAIRHEAYERTIKNEKDYLERLSARCRENGTDPLLGGVIRFGRGDGYAEYMVWQTKPLQLIWIQLGDAWSVEDALIRGLRVSDVRRMVESERSLAKLFGGK